LGGGDIKLLAALAVWLGPTEIAWTLVMASGLALCFVWRMRLDREYRLPFAPFIAVSAWSISLLGTAL
jgi:prepilin signal peptidase PulO-like enzyme (type II secretory pathway)